MDEEGIGDGSDWPSCFANEQGDHVGVWFGEPVLHPQFVGLTVLHDCPCGGSKAGSELRWIIDVERGERGDEVDGKAVTIRVGAGLLDGLQGNGYLG